VTRAQHLTTSSQETFICCCRCCYLIVRYDPSNDRIDWGNVKKSILLGDVTELKLGKQTSVFKRFAYRSADGNLCFSLITPKRT
jgi:hypothetical protein